MMEDLPRDLQQQTTVFLTTYGHAMLSWQSVEAEVFEVFALASRIPTGDTAAAIFFALGNISTQLRATDAAARIMFTDDSILTNSWADLVKRVRTATDSRNRIAHGSYDLQAKEGPDGVRYSPSLNKSRAQRLSGRDSDHWPVERISEASKEFEKLHHDLFNFRFTLSYHLNGPPVPRAP
ncbi:MAG: hypothetical protein HYX47_00680 [Burkholderiales bacterium]|nr:hypothetical protein [Burkholderiales bacterium]